MPSTFPPPLEFFPVDIGDYRHHPRLDAAREAEAVAAVLAPFAARHRPWQVAGDERAADAVEQRLSEWARPSDAGNTFLYWVGHGESDGEKALLAHAGSPRPLVHSGISPQDFLDYLRDRQSRPDLEDTWAVVVIDACKSGRFVQLLSGYAHLMPNGPRNFLLVATSEDGNANLGVFRRALHTVLATTFAADSAIDLRSLGDELNRALHGCPVIPHTNTGQAVLHRVVPAAAGTVTTTLDVLSELQLVIDQLVPDEQNHFLPKATGAELGELAWYFEGREPERNTILRWLDTATEGLLLVTGAAGSGKSALLGHILLHTRAELRNILRRSGNLSSLPVDIPCPSKPFDAVIHLAGVTAQDLITRLILGAGLQRMPRELSLNERIDWLISQLKQQARPFTVLLDALDEAHTPLLIADQILRRLAQIPNTRVVVGTRRSTREGPDLPQPDDTDLLDALGASRTTTAPPHTAVNVERDPDAKERYIRRRLERAAELGRLPAVPMQIDQAAADLGSSGHEFLHARLAVHEIIHDPRLLQDPAPLRNSSHRQLFARAVHRLSTRNPTYGPLLHALALAQGRGLPLRDGIWSTIAAAIAPRETAIVDTAISDLAADAAPYLMLDTENEQSVYRLAHRTFTEHFAQGGQEHEQLHQRITSALAMNAERRLSHGELNSYVVQHLAAHAAKGRLPAWQHLAQHTRVLDRLDIANITGQVMTHAFGHFTLPVAVAGAVASQHMAATSSPGDRRGLREVATAHIAGSFRRPQTEPDDALPTWSLSWALLKTIKPVHLTLQVDHGRPVWAAAAFVTADGRTLLAIGGNGSVRVWDPLAGVAVGEPLMGHAGAVRAVAAFAAADGRTLLVSGGDDRVVRVWDPLAGVAVGEPLMGHAGAVRAVAAFAAADGRTLLVSGGDDRVVRVWDPLAGVAVGEPLMGHTNWVRAVAAFAAPDGRTLLVSGGDDRVVRVWDPLAGVAVGEPLMGHAGAVWAVAAFAAPDGRTLLATTGQDATVRVWDPLAGVAVGEPLRGHAGSIRAVAAFAAPDGRTLLATTGHDATVRVWDPLAGVAVGEPLTSDSELMRVMAAFTAPGGRTLLATGSNGGTVRVWDPQAATAVREHLNARIDNVDAAAAFAASDGRTLLVTGHNDGTVQVWDMRAGTPVGEPLIAHTGPVQAMVVFVASDGRTLLATTDPDHLVRVWDMRAGAELREPLMSHTDLTGAVTAFAPPDGSTILATGGYFGGVQLVGTHFTARNGRAVFAAAGSGEVHIHESGSLASSTIPLDFTAHALAGVNGDLAIAGSEGILVIRLQGSYA